MPKFRITAPDGKNFDVEGPEGSTAEQALAQVQAQYAQGPKEQALESVGTLGTLFPQTGMLSDALDKAAYRTGSAVTDVTGSPAAGLAANIGVQAVPMVAGGSLAKAAAPALRGGAEWLMQSAVKPTLKQLRSGDAAKAIDTMLSE